MTTMKTNRATASEFKKKIIPAKEMSAADVTIDGNHVGYIFNKTGDKQYLLSFDFGDVRGMRSRLTIADCLDEADKLYALASTSKEVK